MAKILVIGSGGREHALAWALERSPQVEQVFVAPGNGGTVNNVPIGVSDFPALITFAKENQIDLTVVGPEVPLSEGIVDAFKAEGLMIFGPSQAAAQLEASKDFAKQLMVECGVPTARFSSFMDSRSALEFLNHLMTDSQGFDLSLGLVVKADGLAAGKGVMVCDDLTQAEAAVRYIFDGAFGSAGAKVILEERLEGPEVSLLAFCDGYTALPMLPARDHKRAFDGNQGPNTGGMGVFAPVPEVNPSLIAQIGHTVFEPVLKAMRERGTPYVGVLYAGLMLTPKGIKVLEFNARFGDPETQVILPLLQSDLFEVMQACVQGKLGRLVLDWSPKSAVTVVLASPGYPGDYPKGLPIQIPEQPGESVMVFHAGTAQQGNSLVTSGGRVLCVTALGKSFVSARARAYAAINQISFEGMHYRTDIGFSSKDMHYRPDIGVSLLVQPEGV
jgi:phosphoribosylamine--glycine ligase